MSTDDEATLERGINQAEERVSFADQDVRYRDPEKLERILARARAARGATDGTKSEFFVFRTRKGTGEHWRR